MTMSVYFICDDCGDEIKEETFVECDCGEEHHFHIACALLAYSLATVKL